MLPPQFLQFRHKLVHGASFSASPHPAPLPPSNHDGARRGGTIDQAKQLREAGRNVREIARAVKVPRSTLSRALSQNVPSEEREDLRQNDAE